MAIGRWFGTPARNAGLSAAWWERSVCGAVSAGKVAAKATRDRVFEGISSFLDRPMPGGVRAARPSSSSQATDQEESKKLLRRDNALQE